MMSAGDNLKIASIFVLFVASLSGMAIPLNVSQKSTMFHLLVLPVLNSIAAGVMVGLAFIHLLPEANEKLTEVDPEYPLSNMIAACGIFVVLVFQQLSMIYGSKHTEGKLRHVTTPTVVELAPAPCVNSTECKVHCYQGAHEDTNEAEAPVVPSNESNDSHDEKLCDDGHDHALAVQVILQAHSTRDLVNAYALEISTAIHSFIIGFDLGVMDSADTEGISVLFIALVFHQFVEGIGMGSILQHSREMLSTWKMITFIGIFSITISCGVLVGYCVQAEKADELLQAAIQGSATSIAAGAMLFVSLSELVGNYMNKKEWEDDARLKMLMIGGFGLGIAMMAVIGIWA